jgi:hypothetical protein|tara:strand:+ start:2769 stop:2948 length:180 start_codon:yes stop_codon:yes gene_type:complete
MIQWLKDRWSERSSWDGTVLIGVGVVCILFAPLVKWVAWAAVIYGVWTLFRPEQDNAGL